MVVGFLFDRTQTLVALITKHKPIWQRGKLNGVGGGIEGEETPVEAMNREWQEETKTKPLLLNGEWREFCQMAHGQNYIYFFEGTAAITEQFPEIPGALEQVQWYDVRAALNGTLPVVGNLRWLIAMALDPDKVTCKVNDPTSVQC